MKDCTTPAENSIEIPPDVLRRAVEIVQEWEIDGELATDLVMELFALFRKEVSPTA